MPTLTTQSAATTFVIPPLTDAFARLLALSDEDRTNLRLLELLAHKDPGAVARLLQLANSATYTRGRAANSVYDALQVLGSEMAVCVLMNLWAMDELEVPVECKSTRSWLARHTFSLCATMRRMLQSGRLSEEVPFLELQLTALVDKLALATVLRAQELGSEAAVVLRETAAADDAAMHQRAPLGSVFSRSVSIAQAWGLGPQVQAHLKDLEAWGAHQQFGSLASQAILLGEVLMASPSMEDSPHADVLDVFYEKSSLMHRLVERRIDPMTLPVRF